MCACVCIVQAIICLCVCVCLDYTGMGLGAIVDKGVCVCVRCWLRQTLLCRHCDGQTKVCWIPAGFCFWHSICALLTCNCVWLAYAGMWCQDRQQ